MNEPLHDIDKLFHDGIEGHSEYPGKKVWDKIEAGLDRDTAVVYKKKYKVLKRTAAVLLILFLGIIIYGILNRNPGKSDVARDRGKKTQQEQSNPKQDNKVDENINNSLQQDKPAEINQAQNKDLKSRDQQDNAGIKDRKIKGDDQSPTNSPTGVNGNANFKNNIPDKKNRSRNEKEIRVNKQKPGKLTRDDKLAIDMETPAKIKRDKTNNGINSQITSSAGNNDKIKVDDKPARPSFNLLSFNLERKNVNDVLKPSVTIYSNGSVSILGQLTFPKFKKSANSFLVNRGFSLQAYFLPGTAWNKLEDDQPHQPGGSGGPGGPPVQDHHEIEKNETKTFVYSTGVKLNYGLSKKISVQTGLNYTKSSTSENAKKIYAERDNNGHVRYRIDCSSGYTYLLPKSNTNPTTGDTKTVSDTKNTLSYLGIPVNIEYRILSGKFSLSASAGAQASILLNGKTSTVFDKGTPNESSASSNTQGLKSGYFSALAGITGELRLNNKFSLTIAPSGQFGLSSINDGASVKTRPVYLGLSAGVKLKL